MSGVPVASSGIETCEGLLRDVEEYVMFGGADNLVVRGEEGGMTTIGFRWLGPGFRLALASKHRGFCEGYVVGKLTSSDGLVSGCRRLDIKEPEGVLVLLVRSGE